MKEQVMELVAEACALAEEITEETPFASLSVDSLSFIVLLVRLEQTFSVSFSEEELTYTSYETVGDLIRKTEEKLHEKK